jgi:hypothetical protein
MITNPKYFVSSEYSFPSKIEIQMDPILPTFQDQYRSFNVRFGIFANTLYMKACKSGIGFSLSFVLLERRIND